ncbi:MAG: transporter substrate-binding domain-containing protein [Candidatus Cloacimonetes bacterium]|nr:transporter substrate-binding domain-containing protein [Candidatus Cloacimonadota bacterium]
MKKIVFIMIVCILVLFISCSQKPMIFTYLDYPPYCWTDAEGNAHGIYIDIINEVVRDRMGIPVVYQEHSWDVAQKLVQDGEADAFITVPTPERREYTEISNEPLVSDGCVLFTQKDNKRLEEIQKITNLPELKDFTLLDYTGSGWARQHLADFDVEWMPGIKQVLIELANGKGDIFVQPPILTKYNIKELKLEDKLIEIPNSLDEIHFYLCVGKNSSFVHILPEFDRIITEMKQNGSLQKIIDSY